MSELTATLNKVSLKNNLKLLKNHTGFILYKKNMKEITKIKYSKPRSPPPDIFLIFIFRMPELFACIKYARI